MTDKETIKHLKRKVRELHHRVGLIRYILAHPEINDSYLERALNLREKDWRLEV